MSFRRPFDFQWTPIWYPSVHWKYGTSKGRPNSVHYGCPLDICIGRPTDVHLRPTQQRHVCKFISWTMSSLIYFEVLCTKLFFTVQSLKTLNISLWVWKCSFWKGTKDAGRSREKDRSNLQQLFNLNRSIPSFI